MTLSTNEAPRGWDEAAEGWNRSSALIRAWLRECTAELLDSLAIGPGSRVLDVAAGAGEQTLDIARRVGAQGNVLATDLSANILALAHQNFREAGLEQCATRLADAQALGLAGANFDAATCRLGLMFCPSPASALQEIRAALAPGGRFSALVFSTPQANPCITLTMQAARRHAGAGPGDPYAPGSLLSLGQPGLLERMLRAAGFAEVAVRPVQVPFRVDRCDDYMDFLRSAASPVIELLRPLSEDARSRAWSDISVELARFQTVDGWEGPNELLICRAINPAEADTRSAAHLRQGPHPA